MKPEERHQLEQNELADGVLRLSNKVRPYVPYFLIAIVVVAGASVAYAYWTNAQQQRQEEAWQSFFAAMNENQPDSYETLVARYPDAKVVPYAKLRIADLKFERGKKSLINDRTQALGLIDEAIGLYEALTASSSLDVQEQAMYCQGLATESKGALGEARSVYERVTTNFPNTIWAARAAERIRQIDTPQAKQFYATLSEFKPIPATTDLPPLDNSPVPPPPSSVTPLGEMKEEVPTPPAEAKEELPAPPAEEKSQPEEKAETEAPKAEEAPAAEPKPEEPAPEQPKAEEPATEEKASEGNPPAETP
jgi:tetratricopeptide (TPR) repeat protein